MAGSKAIGAPVLAGVGRWPRFLAGPVVPVGTEQTAWPLLCGARTGPQGGALESGGATRPRAAP